MYLFIEPVRTIVLPIIYITECPDTSHSIIIGTVSGTS